MLRCISTTRNFRDLARITGLRPWQIASAARLTLAVAMLLLLAPRPQTMALALALFLAHIGILTYAKAKAP